MEYSFQNEICFVSRVNHQADNVSYVFGILSLMILKLMFLKKAKRLAIRRRSRYHNTFNRQIDRQISSSKNCSYYTPWMVLLMVLFCVQGWKEEHGILNKETQHNFSYHQVIGIIKVGESQLHCVANKFLAVKVLTALFDLLLLATVIYSRNQYQEILCLKHEQPHQPKHM